MIPQRSKTFWSLTQLALIVAIIGAGWVGGDLALGLSLAGVLVVSLVAFEFGTRRGWAIAGLSTGVGDERVRSIYREAGFRTSEMLMYGLTIWLTVSMAQGDENSTLLAVVLAYAALWVGNLTWLSLSGRRPARTRA